MRSKKRTLLITAVLGIALLMAGCTSALSGGDGSDVDTNGMTAEEIQTKAANASESVETATFTQDMTMDIDGQGSIDMDANGAIDMDAEKMRMEAEMDMDGQSFETTQYIIGDQMYVNTNGVWQQQATPQNIWDNSRYAQQQDALESASEVEVVDKTTTNGNEVYVMDVDIDEEKMVELARQQAGQEGMGQMYDQMDISNVEMTQHVDTESYLIRHVEMEMDVSMMGEDVTMTMTMTYDEINEPVDITLPEEAEQAERAGSNY